jgi:hypothetical protein
MLKFTLEEEIAELRYLSVFFLSLKLKLLLLKTSFMVSFFNIDGTVIQYFYTDVQHRLWKHVILISVSNCFEYNFVLSDVLLQSLIRSCYFTEVCLNKNLHQMEVLFQKILMKVSFILYTQE